MKIIHLNTFTYKQNITFPHYSLHKELLRKNHNSFIVSAKSDIDEKEIFAVNDKTPKGNLILSRLIRKLLFNKLLNKSLFYPEWNLDRVKLEDIQPNIPFEPDIILTYWTKYAFNQKLVYEISQYYNAPVLCLMVDMAPLTGGCHYAFDCKNYYFRCGKCPAIKSFYNNDLSRITYNFKLKYLEKTNISFVAGSQTLFSQVQNSYLTKNKDIYKIIFGVNDKVYYNASKNLAKKQLGINEQKKVIFFGAVSIKNKRKGYRYLLEALNELYDDNKKVFNNKDVLLLIAGNDFSDINMPYPYKYMGYLHNEEELALAYRACDVFVCPSVEDSGPLMINQAIASGRPVVAFEMGVAIDLVISGKTGYRARIRDSYDFARGIKQVLSLSEREWGLMSDECRILGSNLCSIKKMTEQIIKIADKEILKVTNE